MLGLLVPSNAARASGRHAAARCLRTPSHYIGKHRASGSPDRPTPWYVFPRRWALTSH